jgi:hypothetical protein
MTRRKDDTWRLGSVDQPRHEPWCQLHFLAAVDLRSQRVKIAPKRRWQKNATETGEKT